MTFSRLLLIIPPQHSVMEGFRTALVSLASYVSQRLPKLEIMLLDLSTTPRPRVRAKLARAIGDGRNARTLAGISTVTADYQGALLVARELKNLDSDIVVVLGGHHASGDSKVILEKHRSHIDVIVRNEGEVALTQLLQHFPAIETVPGIAFMRGPQFVSTPSAALLGQEDLDQIPLTFRDWDLSATPGKFDHVTYVSARGCPLACSFCAVANQAVRTKSPNQVMRDVRGLVEMGYARIAFEDNFFAQNRKRTREVCNVLMELRADGLTFNWDCQTRIESIDEERVDLMERAGCDAVYLGVEALTEKSLKFLGKTLDPRGYLNRIFDTALPRLLNSGLATYINLQFGLPYEGDIDIDHMLRSLEQLGKMAAALDRTITVFPQLFVVYPGTEHFKHYVRYREFARDVFETFTEWEDEQKPVLTWLGSSFAHGTGGLPLGILDRTQLGRGRYVVDELAVARVEDALDRIDRLRGIKVFRYGNYLVKENADEVS
jgi:radical SAM superfamily enzyme YgiQ (UPF0313 family)